ncbi:MAG: class I SAM-dependent methyltransferase [Rhodoferax sp.]|nr:class I SAM-dependent methyltransferase [Rhodoferax sp.]
MNCKSDNQFRSNATDLRHLILGMRAAYARGDNAMEYARQAVGIIDNSVVATLIAYDLQAGSYVASARANPEGNSRWCAQLAEIINPFLAQHGSLLEVGCGEATTLAGVAKHLNKTPEHALGFDISWSRCAEGVGWLSKNEASARLFVADLFDIPLEDASVDVVYTSHSLEPNGGREEDAIRELMRVARRAVVLVEPVYELANSDAQARMLTHGYVRELKETAERLGANVSGYRLLDYIPTPLNPSGLVLIEKEFNESRSKPTWRCPLTHLPLSDLGDVFAAVQAGLIYPVLRGIPMLRVEHGIVASKITSKLK